MKPTLVIILCSLFASCSDNPNLCVPAHAMGTLDVQFVADSLPFSFDADATGLRVFLGEKSARLAWSSDCIAQGPCMLDGNPTNLCAVLECNEVWTFAGGIVTVEQSASGILDFAGTPTPCIDVVKGSGVYHD